VGFGFPEAFLLLLLLPPLLWILRRGEQRADSVVALFKSRPPGKWHARIRYALTSLFMVSLIAVGAKPYIETNQTGTFLFLVDVSRSMEARYSCTEPTFLARAKSIMQDVIEAIPEARYGIVAFDRLAIPITQITYDRAYLEQAIEYGLHIGLSYEATATQIPNALTALAEKKQRLPEFFGDVGYVIMLSDGNMPGNYQTALRLPLLALEKVGVKVISVGTGNAGETPVPVVTANGVCQKQQYTDMEGKQVAIPLRDDILSFIAAGTQGEYFGEAQTEALIQYLRINGLEDIEEGVAIGENQRRDISRVFLLFAALACFGILLLRSIRFI